MKHAESIGAACASARPLLNRWVEGELSWWARRRVRRHLDECPLCAREVETLQDDTAALLGGLFPPPSERSLSAPRPQKAPVRASVRILTAAAALLIVGALVTLGTLGVRHFAADPPTASPFCRVTNTETRRAARAENQRFALTAGHYRAEAHGAHGHELRTSALSVVTLDGQLDLVVSATHTDATLRRGHAVVQPAGDGDRRRLQHGRTERFTVPTKAAEPTAVAAPTPDRGPREAASARPDRAAPAPAPANPTAANEVTGVVRDTDGRAIRGARVSIRRMPTQLGDVLSVRHALDAAMGLASTEITAETVSGDDGTFAFPNITGRIALTVSRDGFAGWSRVLSTPAGVDVVLVAEGRIAGRVLDNATGRPVVGARVTYHDPGTSLPLHHVISDQDGRYRLRGIAPETHAPLPGRIAVAAAGYRRAHFPSTYDRSATVVRDLRLSRGLTITGRVTSASGEPLRDVTVAVDQGAAQSIRPDGTFTVSGATAVSNVIVRSPGFVTRRIALSRDRASSRLDVTLEPAHPLEGVARTASGRALTGLRLSVYPLDRDTPLATTTTDRDGAFRFDELARDRAYRLGERAGTASRVRNVTFRDRPLELVIKSAGNVRGRVTLAGRAMEGVPIYVIDQAGGKATTVASGITGRNGAYALAAPTKGRHLLAVPGPGFLPWFRPLRIRSDETAVQVVRLSPGVSLSGRVIDENDRPVEGAVLWTKPRSFPVTTGRDGRFTFRGLDRRSFRLFGIGPGIFFASKAKQLAGPTPGDTHDLELVLAAEPRLAGTVRDASTHEGLFSVNILGGRADGELRHRGISLQGGRFQFPIQAADADERLVFFRPGYEPRWIRPPAPSTDGARAPIDVGLVPSRTIRGRVLLPDGTAAARGGVFAFPAGAAATPFARDPASIILEAAYIGKEGRFEIHVPTAEATLYAVTIDGVRAVRLRGDETDVTIQTRPAARIALEIRDADGPVRGKSYYLTRGDVNAGYRYLTMFRRAGLERAIRRGIAPVEPGTYRLRLTTRDGRSVTRSIELEPGENPIRVDVPNR